MEKGIPQVLQIVTRSASSQLRLFLSYQQIYGLRWRLSFKLLTGLPRTKIIEENIDTARNLVEEKSNSSISEVSTSINLFTGTVWKILRKILRKYPYKHKTVQCLTDHHKPCWVQFYDWILQQNE